MHKFTTDVIEKRRAVLEESLKSGKYDGNETYETFRKIFYTDDFFRRIFHS